MRPQINITISGKKDTYPENKCKKPWKILYIG